MSSNVSSKRGSHLLHGIEGGSQKAPTRPTLFQEGKSCCDHHPASGSHLCHVIEVQQQCCMSLEAIGSSQQGRKAILMSQEVLTSGVPAAEAVQRS
jgi:hypothetical protein